MELKAAIILREKLITYAKKEPIIKDEVRYPRLANIYYLAEAHIGGTLNRQC